MRATTSQLPATVRTFTQRFSATRRGARLARLLAVLQLDAWGVRRNTEPSDTAASVIAELTANAALHGRVPGRDFELQLILGAGMLRIEVTDTRPEQLPQTLSPDVEAEGGRGLLIVAALAERWGVTPGPEPRKTVWAEVACGA